MAAESQASIDSPIYTYVIASGDMRYIEINQRNLFLRRDPNLGLILRGELPGCGPGCYVDLNQVLLEYAMTCEGCVSLNEAEEYVASFGQRLGQLLARQLELELSSSVQEDRLPAALEILLKSMSVPYTCQRSPQRLSYQLEYCPLCDSGTSSGMARQLVMARYGFTALCNSLVVALASGWRLVKPLHAEADQDLLAVIVEFSA